MEIKLDKRPPAYYSKFQPERIQKILDAISKGVPKKIAAEANGVTDRIFYYWLEQGNLDIDHDVDSQYAALVRSLRAVELSDIERCQDMNINAEDCHRGAQWRLERTYWRHFSAKVADIEFDERLKKLEEAKNGQG